MNPDAVAIPVWLVCVMAAPWAVGAAYLCFGLAQCVVYFIWPPWRLTSRLRMVRSTAFLKACADAWSSDVLLRVYEPQRAPGLGAFVQSYRNYVRYMRRCLANQNTARNGFRRSIESTTFNLSPDGGLEWVHPEFEP